ncbi:hypothetical protein GCM10010260_75840 [Streptomyces filipinensis]|uniref:Uncharacterized protein n=1 Tax=Streptomyces filipinensis TaxID=66887 RepID=A0A918MFZ1_9ACTN|nr:hypothetical protein GCM10010260_75840 [Streptomyces filipinensis]
MCAGALYRPYTSGHPPVKQYADAREIRILPGIGAVGGGKERRRGAPQCTWIPPLWVLTVIWCGAFRSTGSWTSGVESELVASM